MSSTSGCQIRLCALIVGNDQHMPAEESRGLHATAGKARCVALPLRYQVYIERDTKIALSVLNPAGATTRVVFGDAKYINTAVELPA